MTSSVVHWRWETRDPDVADQVIRDTLPGGSVTLRSPIGRLREELNGDAAVTESRVRLTGTFDGVADVETVVFITIPIEGDWAWTIGDEHGAADHPFLSQPGERVRTRITDNAMRVITFDAATLAGISADLFGPGVEFRFDGPHPVSPELERFWIATAAMAGAVFRDPGLADQPVLHAAARRQLAVATFEAFRLAGDRAARNAAFGDRERLRRRAVAYVDEHAHEPITPEDVARAVGVPTVTLDDLLRAMSTTSTVGVIRGARLAAAHRELTRSDSGSTTIADVARAWGYRDPATFARHYRRAYGQPPSHTLRG